MGTIADDILENMVQITKMHAGKVIAEGKVERLEREKAELLAALIGIDLFFRRPDEDSNEAFERVAATFRNQTGYLRPGKDCVLHDPKVRQRAWDDWVAKKLAAARDAITKATTQP